MFLNLKLNLNVVDVTGSQEAKTVAGAAGGWHSDGLRLSSPVVLADQHHAHIHADIAPF